jgi:hypothetical protein
MGVNDAVGVTAFDGVAVLDPQTLAAVQGTTARAKEEIVERRQWGEFIIGDFGCGHGKTSCLGVENAIQPHAGERV